MQRLLSCLAVIGLVACAEFPELDGTINPDVAALPYPQLEPLDPVLAAADATPATAPESIAATKARADALRARAAGLRGPVLDATTQDRLQDRIDDAPLR